jgi:hypothetical protein
MYEMLAAVLVVLLVISIAIIYKSRKSFNLLKEAHQRATTELDKLRVSAIDAEGLKKLREDLEEAQGNYELAVSENDKMNATIADMQTTIKEMRKVLDTQLVQAVLRLDESTRSQLEADITRQATSILAQPPPPQYFQAERQFSRSPPPQHFQAERQFSRSPPPQQHFQPRPRPPHFQPRHQQNFQQPQPQRRQPFRPTPRYGFDVNAPSFVPLPTPLPTPQ